MPSYTNLAIFFSATIGILVAGGILYRAITSHLRPFFIVGMSWKIAITSVKTNPVSVLSVVILIASGRFLQRLVNAFPAFDPSVLLFLGIVWQALLNMALAMAAVSIHLHVIERVKMRYGLDDFELKKTFTSKLIPAAIYGGVIWFTGWGLLAGARYMMGTVDTEHPNLFAQSLSFLLYLQATLLMLVRPAYSLELDAPFRDGIKSALQSAPSLLVIQACLAIPIVIYNLLFLRFVSHISQEFFLTRIVGDMIFVLFSTLQFFAVEIAAVMLIARLELSRFVFKKTYG